MPGLATSAGARILERFVLQSLVRQSVATPVREQALAISGNEVRHGAPEPDVPMEPESTVHRVNHPVATTREFEGMKVS